ncbi:thioredoxin domain-containing protein [Mycobacterium sp. CVI_P3]|uniref:Thioredoxin domain-containing protein n=1 Tax=Mycobacterium pinniadriaticum TaxID=2994102 RepID=A0ABT3SG96_9MYCO|nr:thioredoxin domain-containing protein [Mycobacterium pinniadriaticum]MCX2932092.1 thioredoxin domain-containing protein [Mycobacterium pinniadriaticum]MCX2938516.1 thioredoxin domain-containing protein [Mycobacterium pinniadriaticum]
MHVRAINRPLGSVAAVLGLLVALVMCGPASGIAHAAAAAPAGDALSIGDPDALGQIDLYVDPLCPYSGEFVRTHGEQISKRIETGALRVNLRFVDFLDKYSASGTYDSRAIYAAYVVADQSRSSDVAWRFIESIYARDTQPEEGGPTDLSNDQLADIANRVGAPQLAQDLIRIGLPIGFDPRVIAVNNLDALHRFPEPGVPRVVINDQPVDEDSDWLAQLPG